MMHCRAFTLVELLVTVTLFGILAAVAIPNYQLYATKAKLMNLITTADTYKLKAMDLELGLVATFIDESLEHPFVNRVKIFRSRSKGDAVTVVQVKGKKFALGLDAVPGEVIVQWQATKSHAHMQWQCAASNNIKLWLTNVCQGQLIS